MAASGRITVEQAQTDSRRHMLRSAVTGDDIELIDLSVRPLALDHGDCIILASDGIHTLDQADIARIVVAYAGDGPQAIAAALIRTVDAARDPQQDNVTTVVVMAARG